MSKQSQLIEIANQIGKGILISHILYIEISNEPSNETEALTIRRRLRELVYNQQQMLQVMHNGQPFPVEITWTINNIEETSSYYYAVNLPYVDGIVENYTMILLNNIVHQIKQECSATGNDWGLAFMIMKPSSLFQPIRSNPVINGDPLIFAAHAGVQLVQNDEEKDEEEGRTRRKRRKSGEERGAERGERKSGKRK
jgi:hypothetical protein